MGRIFQIEKYGNWRILKRYTGEESHVTIPVGVNEIRSKAFYGCISLQSVVIPEGVTRIGWRAFYNCSNLQTVVIPEGVPVDWEMFEGTPFLDSISGDLQIVQKQLLRYRGPSSRVVIPEGVTRIGEKAFQGCSTLQIVVIPEGVTGIGSAAFSECSSLQSVIIPEGVTEIMEDTFKGCNILQNVVIPEGVTEIKRGAFQVCTGLQRVILPKTIRIIDGERTYYDDGYGLYYDSGAFSGCNNLEEINLPEGLGKIGEVAFSGCTRLRNITIPPNLEFIGDDAFADCINLELTVTFAYRQKFDEEFSGSVSNLFINLMDPAGCRLCR